MMYSNKLVCCLKANNKVLREFKDTVFVPFGTEYSILIKNLNSVRVSVDVSIDGSSVMDGYNLIIDPNKELELTRSIRNGNLTAGNCFKFIERTESIEQFRGIKLEDGLIRIQFNFEQPPQFNISPTWSHNRSFYGSADAAQGGGRLGQLRSCRLSSTVATSDVGITVPGSISNQRFTETTTFERGPETYVMVLRLSGETQQGDVVVTPVTVKTKPMCTVCGRTNNATASFCSNCGASLKIV